MSENSPIHVFPSPSPDSLCSLSPLFQHGQSWPSLPSWWRIFIWNSTLTYRRDAHGYCGCLFFAKLSAGKIAAKFTQYLQLWVWLRPNTYQRKISQQYSCHPISWPLLSHNCIDHCINNTDLSTALCLKARQDINSHNVSRQHTVDLLKILSTEHKSIFSRQHWSPSWVLALKSKSSSKNLRTKPAFV